MQAETIKTFVQRSSAISLLLYPLILMVAFALHFDSIADFFDFKLIYKQRTAEQFMQTLSGPQVDRLFLIPHYFGYLAMPFMLISAIVLGNLIFQRHPFISIMGKWLAVFGVLFLSGVFAAWLSFAAVGNVQPELIPAASSVLQELTTMQGPLFYITLLSVFSLVGMVILGVGLFTSQLVSKGSATLFILGHVLIITFMDLDNWMLLGAFLILVGVLPLSKKIFHNTIPTDEKGLSTK